MIHLVMMKINVLKQTHVNPEYVLVQTQLFVLLLINVMSLEHVILHLVIAQIQRNLMELFVKIVMPVLEWTLVNLVHVLVQILLSVQP